MRRQLGLTDCILLVIGTMVGTGIFLTTGSVAGVLHSPYLVLVAWLLGGFFALAGALTYAELSACFPQSGGHYVFMREAYGPFWGFLDGWLSFVVSFPCFLAFMAMGLSEYAGFFCPALTAEHAVIRFSLAGAAVTIHGGHLTALAVITVLTVLNCLGLRAGRNVQNTLTVLKIGCLVFLPALIFASGKGSWSHFAFPEDVFSGGLFPAMAGALIGVTFAYSGWDASTYMAGEVRRPRQSVPRSLAVGTVLVTALYLIFNLALLYQVPASRMSVTGNVTQEAAEGVLGRAGAGITSGIVLVTILGAINATIMIGPRVYYAMATDGLFFRRLSRVHP
ncbi:MAG: amino acid permease, partial [Verrucomicrobia bacterium]|nr:amino acid permease [Verrucomicrobiota bacterium]